MLVIAHVLKASELRLTALVSTLTNVLKILTLAATELHVLTLKAATNVSAYPAHKEIHIMVSVHLPNDDVHPIVNADRMKNVCNLVSVFVHLHFSSMLEMFVEIHVKDSHVESTPNVVQPTHLNVCVKLVSKVILCWVVLAQTNVPMLHVLMAHNVSIKKVDTNAFVPKECLEIRIKVAVYLKILKLVDQLANQTTIVLQIYIVEMELVLVHALIYFVDQMLFVNQKIMLDGADVELDLNPVQMAIVFLVSGKKLYEL